MTTSGQSKYVSERYRRYAVAVNENRAVPRLTDGFKQSQRIALWVLKNEGIKKIKTSGMAGQMIASYLYLHGDQAAGDAVGRMASPYLNNIPMLKGEGNFGSKINPDGMAAPRYTDIRRPDYLDDLVYNDMAILELVDNYDSSARMPSTFLPMLPLVLINGTNGVGVGYNTTIFPRDPKAVAKAVLSVLENPTKKLTGLEPHFMPMTAAAGSFVKYTAKGQPVWSFSGSVKIIDTSTVEITNLPPVQSLNLEEFRILLDEMEENEQIRGYTDNSSDDYSIIVKFPRGQIANWTEADALSFFKLTRSAQENINVVGIDGVTIKTYQYDEASQYPDPVERLIRDWVEWRFTLFKTRFEHLLKEAEKELLFWRVLQQCFEDDLPKRLTSVADRASLREAIKVIAETAGLRPEQIAANPQIFDKIADRASYRWTKDARAECQTQIDDVTTQIATHKAHIKSPDLQKAAFVTDVKTAMASIK